MVYFIWSAIGMYIWRKLGWLVTKNFLYGTTSIGAKILCIAWGIVIAFYIDYMMYYFEPNVFLKVFMGYLLGAYIAVPNYGLVAESTIPFDAMPRHMLIKWLPQIVYVIVVTCLWLVPHPKPI